MIRIAAIVLGMIGCSSPASDTSVPLSTPEASPTPAHCDDGDRSVQRRGTACLCCHSEFGVAGSVEAARPNDLRILVTDVEGRRAEMVPNPFGNFFRHIRLEPPLFAAMIDGTGNRRVMHAPSPHGNCNACHGNAGLALRLGAP